MEKQIKVVATVALILKEKGDSIDGNYGNLILMSSEQPSYSSSNKAILVWGNSEAYVDISALASACRVIQDVNQSS